MLVVIGNIHSMEDVQRRTMEQEKAQTPTLKNHVLEYFFCLKRCENFYLFALP
jgi:hypothetical protein